MNMPRMIVPILLAALAAAVTGAEPKLTRIVTNPFGPEFKAYTPVYVRSLKDPGAVIVRIETGDIAGKGIEEKVQARLKQAYGLEFPIVEAEKAPATGKTFLLPGRNNSNMLLRRLAATWAVVGLPVGSELRVWPAILNWPAGAVYLGGMTEKDILASTEKLVKAFPDPTRLTVHFAPDNGRPAVGMRDALGFAAADLKSTSYTEKEIQEAAAAVRDHLTNQKDMLPHQSVISAHFGKAFRRFTLAADPSAARAFAEMQKVYLELYNVGRNDRNTPPSFTFCQYIWFLEQIELSPAFTAGDRARAAELVRNVIEDCMNYYEMSEPMKNYAAGKRPYYTNHPIFASRTVWTAADYLERHYKLPAAAYWKAVAANAVAGIEPHPIGPEDSASYQHICYRLFTEFALASGLYGMDFFRSPKFQEYVRYLKAQYSPLLFTSGHGDNNPIGGVGGLHMMAYCYDIFGDEEAFAILCMVDRILPGGWAGALARSYGASGKLHPKFSHDFDGLQTFKMDEFRLTRRNKLKYSRPVLDKGYFRSGWEPTADFLCISGVATAPHGHFDVNDILRYSRGQHIWLTEGDYIRVHPEEHNTLALRANGRHVRPGADERGSLAQIVAEQSTPDRKVAALELLAEEYGPTDWRRIVAGEMLNGFWVIDEITAREPADLQADFRWRTLGDMAFDGQNTVTVKQRPSDEPDDPTDFFVAGASPAELVLSSQLDSGHGNYPGGYYINYKYADRFTRVMKFRRTAKLDAKGVLRQAVFMGHRKLPVRQLGAAAWAAGTEYLALAGNHTGNGIEFTGERLYVFPSGVIGRGVKSVKIGNWSKVFAKPTDFALNERVALPDFAEAAETRVAPPAPLPAKKMSGKTFELPAAVSALAAGPDGFGAGCEDGSFHVVSPDGKVRWTATAPGPVETVCGFRDGRAVYWAAARGPANIRDRQQPGTLHVYDASGKLLWQKKYTAYHSKPGLAVTLFPAKLTREGGPALVAGLSGWHYEAYRAADGKLLWKRTIYHGATAGAAGDMDGDGLDEVCAGSEYYWHWTLKSNGQRLFNRTAPPWDYATAAVDLDGDGKTEFLCGRSDSKIYPIALDKHPLAKAVPLNAGGLAVGIFPIGKKGDFVVAAENGRILWADGKFAVKRTLDLPGGISSFAQGKGGLYAACRDGHVYRIDNGKAAGRISAKIDPASIRPARVAANESGAAVSAGTKLILVKP